MKKWIVMLIATLITLNLCSCSGKTADTAGTMDDSFDVAMQDMKDDAASGGTGIDESSEVEFSMDADQAGEKEPASEEAPQLIELNKNTDGYVILGEYEQDNDKSNGPEPIEWMILDENENGILLISRYALECEPYDHSSEDTTWETCSLREWMNNDFYNKAFSNDEKKLINTTHLVNEDNRKYGTDGGNDTEDKVFALSTLEAMELFELNDWWEDKDIGFSEKSMAEGTPYVLAKGALVYEPISEADLAGEFSYLHYSSNALGTVGVCWWLRSSGGSGICVADVDNMGEFGPGFYGSYQTYTDYCARPALYILKDTVIH